jgi:hypothetical protein
MRLPSFVLPITLGLVVVSSAEAQGRPPTIADVPRFRIGAGLGFDIVTGVQGSKPLAGPGIDARFDWRVRKGMTIGASFGFYGMNDEKPRADDVSVLTNPTAPLIIHRTPKLAQTRTMLCMLQWELPSAMYVRAGGGIGGHSYAAYYPYPPNPIAIESMEWGLTFAFAGGKEWRRGRGLGVAAEGFLIVSGPEDSTAIRTVAGAKLVLLR